MDGLICHARYGPPRIERRGTPDRPRACGMFMLRSPRMYRGFLTSSLSLRRSLATAPLTTCGSPRPPDPAQQVLEVVTPPASSDSACGTRYPGALHWPSARPAHAASTAARFRAHGVVTVQVNHQIGVYDVPVRTDRNGWGLARLGQLAEVRARDNQDVGRMLRGQHRAARGQRARRGARHPAIFKDFASASRLFWWDSLVTEPFFETRPDPVVKAGVPLRVLEDCGPEVRGTGREMGPHVHAGLGMCRHEFR